MPGVLRLHVMVRPVFKWPCAVDHVAFNLHLSLSGSSHACLMKFRGWNSKVWSLRQRSHQRYWAVLFWDVAYYGFKVVLTFVTIKYELCNRTLLSCGVIFTVAWKSVNNNILNRSMSHSWSGRGLSEKLLRSTFMRCILLSGFYILLLTVQSAFLALSPVLVLLIFLHKIVLFDCAVQGGSNFWVCGWNSKVWPLK